MNKIYKEKKEFKDITPASYKDQFPFFKEVDSLALANAQLNRNKAFKAFFRNSNCFDYTIELSMHLNPNVFNLW